ncbi:4'-phosphopantetheinyl transferase superfamily protein [Mucilaginibacter frigoritolerans]|uniref:4'-phosphopantetheinyl transferase superfamily protein n=1 Tax=Mucilaginibacter frigoritolerans TaxID=652788 RepID=A0A562TRZ4_9SPHI|nr:4'-phosphopantetheinyl transferase superfamily protein [Mucilaginibacter frigoritolerans]TWI96379.1 4'-phosphopantetheinyl transferase superfamily protein [Mucilaginibacter frigoritolerans]
MISTGNDIVALRSINKQRTCEYRFYSKILSASEQALYQQPQLNELPFEHYVWLLWSVKESAFKYLKRYNQQLVFSPISINTTTIDILPDQHYCGEVHFNSNKLFFNSIINNDWISTVVNNADDFENVFSDVHVINDKGYYDQSTAVRKFALEKLNTLFPGELRLEKHLAGYPILIKDDEDTKIPVSLAHDGHYISYSFNLNAVKLQVN